MSYYDRFKGTIRLQRWDYSTPAKYFVTFCAKDRVPYFGEVKNGKMKLSFIGNMAVEYWKLIPDYFPYTRLDVFVVMPDHIHGIIEILPSETTEKIINPAKGGVTGNKNPMLQQNLSRIIRWYKGRVSYEVRKNGHTFFWQSRFYEHIVRDQQSLNRIRKYIIDNPKNYRSV